MAYTWTLLFSLFTSPILRVCTASPLPSVEVMKMAKQLVVRLDDFQVIFTVLFEGGRACKVFPKVGVILTDS